MEINPPDGCPGQHRCHGCMKWCDSCGNVAHVCDVRLRGDRCDQHPVPPTRALLASARRAAVKAIVAADQTKREALSRLEEVNDAMIARRAYDAQCVEEGRLAFLPTGS